MGIPAEPERQSSDRLESWKEIAAHLNKGVRTVIRWEKTEGLPVRRHQHLKKSSVFAFRSEIDAWWQTRGPALQASQPAVETAPPARGVTREALMAVAAVAIAVVAVLVWTFRPEPPLARPLKAEPLTSYPGSQLSPSFSPGGNHFAFVWNGLRQNNSDIYIQAIGSAEPRRLTTDPASDFSPAWSPDGKWIAFLRRTGDLKVTVHLIPPFGGTERQFAGLHIRHYMDGAQLGWTPDAKWLAVADAEGDRHGLFLIALDTGEKRVLTSSPIRRGHLEPIFSPDGRNLAFRCNNNEEYSQICVMPLSEGYQPAGEPQAITSQQLRSTGPVWAPDGRHLIFSSGPVFTNSSLYRQQVFPLAARSKPPEQLTAALEQQFSLAMSQRGDLLAYSRKTSDSNIWAIRKDGSRWKEPEIIPEISSSGRDISPEFSPDGKYIAFASDRSGSMEVWVARSDGSQPRKISSLVTETARAPRWSPDGKRLAFSTGRHRSSSVYIAGAMDGNVRQLVTEACCPSWSHDGRWIYFNREVDRKYLIFKIPADGGAAQRIAGLESANEFLEDSGPLESPDGQFLYYRRSDGIWRSPVSGGTQELIARVERCQAWTVRKDGLLTMEILGATPRTNRNPLLFHPFDGGPVFEIAAPSRAPETGLTVSPDGNTMLFSNPDYVRINIMSVRGF